MNSQDIEKLAHLLSQEEALARKELGGVAIKDPASGGFQPMPADYDGDVREDDIVREATLTETNTALEQELKHHLAAILKAQEKLKTDHYGVCEKCGKEIPIERLLELPMTPFCIEHAE
jgi:RNA polymerase-binding transcription factor DksA